jgi:hypothetical protein
MKFASKIAEEFAEDNELTLEDFKNYDIDKIYKHHVIEKIKEKNIARKISVNNKICECCNKTWPSKQHIDKHYESNYSQLYFAKKELKDKDILLTRLSNKISILQVRLDSYKKELLVYQDMFKSSSSEPELELEFNSDYGSE